MDNLDSSQLKLKYTETKLIVKKWESTYLKENGTRPSKDALHAAPSEIKDAYKTYWRLTKYLTRNEKQDKDKNSTLNLKFLENLKDSKKNSKSLNLSILKENNHLSSSPTTDLNFCNSSEKLSQSNIKSSDNLEISSSLIRNNSEHKPEESSFASKVTDSHLLNKNNDNHSLSQVWGAHLNKKKVAETSIKNFEPSLYNKMAENMRNHAIVTTRMSLKRNPRKNDSIENSEQEKNNTQKENLETTLQNKDDSLNNEENVLNEEFGIKATMPCIIKKNIVNSESISVNHLSVDKVPDKKNISNRRLNKNWVKRCTEIPFEINYAPDEKEDADFQNISKTSPTGKDKINKEDLHLNHNDIYDVDNNFHSEKHTVVQSANDSAIYSFDSNSYTNSKAKLIPDKTKLSCVSEFLSSQTNKMSDLGYGIEERNGNVTSCQIQEDGFSFEEEENSTPNQESSKQRSYKEKKEDFGKNSKKFRDEEVDWAPNSKRTLEEDEDGEKLTPKPKRKRKASKKADVKTKTKIDKSKNQKVELKIDKIGNNIDKPENNIPVYDELQELGDGKGSKTGSRKYYSKEERLKYKIANGKLNDNFVKINLKKKVFVRGKRRMTSEKYKRVEWKKKQVEKRADGGDERAIKKLTCFRCGDFGHWANKCPGKIGDNLIPLDSFNDGDTTFLTIEEAANLAEGVHNSASEGITRVFKEKDPTSQDDNILSAENSDNEILSDWDETDLCALEEAEKASLETQNVSKVISNRSDEKDVNPSVQPLYKLNSDGNVIETPKEVIDTLHLFGYTSFRKGQEEVIMRVLSGQSTLVVQSTGSGKSLCYQLPAYLYAKHFNCITLCVSPLVSLMEDQVTGLPPILKAVCLHTQQSASNREKALNALKQGGVHILLVSPEAIVSSRGGGVLGTLLKELPPVAFACLDEAHCLSEWSHNFRPSYLQVCEILKERFNVNTFLGLTATARNETAVSIAKHLHISLFNQGVIMGTCIPDNLVLSVSRDAKREEALIHLLTGERFESCSSIIIYCTRREECERIATFIRTQMLTASKIDVKSNAKRTRGFSLDAEAYHAGLSGYRRQQIQKRFMNGKLRIVVATVAFGMGIDKADVQGIIHYNMPRNLESYVQEIGRAGRDGNTAHCHLFLDNSDGKDIQELKRHIFANSVDRYVVRKLLNKIFEQKNCVKIKKLLNQPNNEYDTNVKNVEINVDTGHPSLKDGSSNEFVCPGHEVALPITELIETLDLPEENIQTLMCYLEMHPHCGLKLMHHAYATCVVSCYRGPRQLCAISKKCPPLAVAIALERKKGKSFDKTNSITFPVIDIASQMGWNSRIVKQELKNLEWERNGSSFKPSGVKVEFSDLAFHLTCKCDLSEEEQDKMLEDIYDRACKQEKDHLKQLHYTYEVLYKASHSSIIHCCDEADEEKCSILKEKIKNYFSQCNNSGLRSVHLEEKLYIRPEIEQRIRGDIRSLLSIHSDQSWTGRGVARIFHGISSPNFPSKVWGRVRKFWRLHLETDFNLLLTIASKEILKCR
ncbi:UNVERIFIED_CONTAM: hypothetical protein RMT77_000600 [Armadillidium vulgare]